MAAGLNSKAITAFSLDGVTGTINEAAKTIAVTMPYGTSVTGLIATFTATGANVKVGATLQIGGTTANNFTNPVTYTVTAPNGTTAAYTVTVIVAASPAKAITSYSFYGGVTGTINEAAKTITVIMPNGTNVIGLIATFTTTGANVKVGAVTQVSGSTPNYFTIPVTYKVTAADGTTAIYTVTVTVSAVTSKLSDTGQTTCFNNSILFAFACPSTGQPFYGQDASYAKTNQPSYTDNGNETVTDNVTGLMWQKEDDNNVKTWVEAVNYCANLTLAGFVWHLPALIELEGIVNNGAYYPAINTTYFPNTKSSSYWSSTTFTGGNTNAWSTGFNDGNVYYYHKGVASYVRCVRAG